MVLLERNTGILPVFAYHPTDETPMPLSLAFANVASMLRMKCACPEAQSNSENSEILSKPASMASLPSYQGKFSPWLDCRDPP
jgi:hypothetical protein